MKIRISALLIVAGMSLPLMAEPLGPLTTSGNVWTNQIAVPTGSSVYPGDVIKTDSSGVAVVSTGTRRVEVRPESQVTLHNGELDLHHGSVATSQSVVRHGSTLVSSGPEQSDSWMVVSTEGGRTLVAAYRGDAVIRSADGGRLIVPSGSFALAAASPRSSGKGASRGAKDSDDDTETPPAATTGNKGWKIGSLKSTTGVLIATGAAAATLTGFAVTGDGDLRDPAVSPR